MAYKLPPSQKKGQTRHKPFRAQIRECCVFLYCFDKAHRAQSADRETWRALFSPSTPLNRAESAREPVSNVSYQPPGTELSLLNSVSFSLPEKRYMICGPYLVYDFLSLFQLLAGISKPTSGSIYIQKYGNDGNPVQSPEPLSSGRVGIIMFLTKLHLGGQDKRVIFK
ncbi:hypothetical protein GBA52_011711 [Prunus armeniaca]|nr:hypothetical protein GBA52_011711 [Prunus armeniaca]